MDPRFNRSPVRVLAVVVLPLALGCVSEQASAIWVEMPPLLYPRYFHRAAVGPDGQIIAFAGRMEVNPGIGAQTSKTEIYDPKSHIWREGPDTPEVVSRSTSRTVRHELDGSWTYRYEHHTSDTMPRFELPPGTGTPDGRAFWFGEVAPIFFDFGYGHWSQGTPPRRAPVYLDAATGGWVEETAAPQDEDWHHKNPPSRWVTSVPAFQRTGSATAAAPDGTIYISGGIGYATEGMDRHSESKWEIYSLLDSLERYDPATETWQVLAPLPQARQLHAAAVGRDGRLYVFGGYGHVGSVTMREGETEAEFEARAGEMKALGRRALDSVHAYDPETDTWEPLAPLPSGRHAMGAALGADGKIYVVGGAVSYSNPRGADTVFVYDPATDRWSKGPPLRRARFHHAVAAGRDGRIYAIGGRVNRLTDTAGTATVEVFDTANPPKPEGW